MKGIIAAQGMAFAKAFIVPELEIQIDSHKVDDVQAEVARLHKAVADCAESIERLMESLAAPEPSNAPKNGVSEEQPDYAVATSNASPESEILDFQLLLLEDADFIGKIEDAVTSRHCNSEYAVNEASGEYVAYLESIEDNDYLRERAADVRDLAQRLLAVLSGVGTEVNEPDCEYVAIGSDIPPSRVAALNKGKLKGIVLENGGITSHSVIISKSMGIPCLIKTAGILEAARGGGSVLLDCIAGEAIMSPCESRIVEYEKFKLGEMKNKALLRQYAKVASKSIDGAEMKIFANVTSGEEAEQSMLLGGEGVGLFRSELLYMSQTGRPPSEDVQYAEYSKAAKALSGKPLVVRTLDIGGDKQIGYMNIEAERNPFLGYRAIRYCLDHHEIFKPQISAILRAGADGDVRIMFPMIACIAEFRAAKLVVAEVKDELAARDAPFDKDMRVGVMIETPAAAFDAVTLAKEADFFSIGTNDLAQYLFAADRGDARLSGLISHFQPALLRAIYMVVNAAHSAGIEADICGEAAGVDLLVPLWLAMGVDNLSVGMSRITAVRKIICDSVKADCLALLEEILRLDTAAAVEAALRGFADKAERLHL